MSEILDATALQNLGHDEVQVQWFLSLASRGMTGAAYSTRDEYERLLPSMPRGSETKGGCS